MIKCIKYLFLGITVTYLIGCSSGPYEMEEITIQYEEKTIIADTIKVVTENNDKIKEEITSQPNTFDFIIQIGAFINQSYFEVFYNRAKSVLGDGVYYELKNNLYKIRVGKYNNRADAMKYLDKVRGLGYFDAFIVTVKNR